MTVSQAGDGGQGAARLDDVVKRAEASLQASPRLSQSPFHKLWRAGYRRIIPITRYDAPLSEHSTLSRRPGARGKAPGLRRPDGLWTSFNWPNHETKESDLDAWEKMEAGVGIRTGEQADGTWLIAIDADTLSEEHAALIGEIVRARFGKVPRRVGNAPKALYLLRSSGPLRYACIEFDDGIPTISGSGKKVCARVELLGDGRQFVASGIHPHTLTGYTWPGPLQPLSTLPTVSPTEILDEAQSSAGLMGELSAALPKAKSLRVQAAAVDRAKVDQEKLKGEPDIVRKAVNALPNTMAAFPNYDDMIRVGAAIRGALADHPGEAAELFHEWSARWEGGDYREDTTEGYFASLTPPYAIGASWLYDQAEKHSGGAFTRATIYHESLPDIDTAPSASAEEWPEPLDLFANADPGELAEPPTGSLPSVIEDFARDEARRKGVTMAFAATSAIGVCASAIGASLKVQVYEHDGGWLEPASLWITLVAPPGTGKSPMINAALKPLKAVDAERYREFKPRHDAWLRLQKAKGKKAEDVPPLLEPIQAGSIVDDVTFEKQVRIHAENPRGILRNTDELTGLLGSLGAYKRGGEGDRAGLLRVFDGDELLQDRVGSGTVRAEHALMGIVVGTQPDKIRALARDLGTDGLLQRMIFVLHDGKSRHGIDEPADKRAARAYAEAVRYLANMNYGRGEVVCMTSEAQVLLREARENIASLHHLTSVSAACRGHLEKWGRLLPRIALTFHCLDNLDLLDLVGSSAPIDADTMRRVIAFSRFLLRHSLRFHEEYGVASEDASEAQWIGGHILTKPGLRSIDRRDLYSARKALQGPANLPVLLAAMRELENVGWCRAVLSSRDASGPKNWEINPEVHTRFGEQGARETKERGEKRAKIKTAGALRASWVHDE